MSKTVSDYLAEMCRQPSASAVYAFRGQEKSSWPLRSAAARRLLNHYRVNSESGVTAFPELHVEYHKNVLIDRARTRGFDLEDGRTLADLEILAKLQHFGAATGLLDFTYSPLIALWFACRKEECDGKVFSINTTDPLTFGKVTHQVMQRGISEVLAPDADAGSTLPWIWEPVATGDAETRVLVQNSLFVIGRPSIAEDVAHETVVRKEDKAQLRKELNTIHAIREETLFKDVYGFAQVNRASYPVPPFEGPELYLLFGSRKAQEGDYQGAIVDYDRSISLDSTNGQAYIYRGDAKSNLGRHEEAINDFDQAIRLDPANDKAYIHRGDAKGKLGRYEEAVADLDKAVHSRTEWPLAYTLRGRMMSVLGRYEEAIADVEQALQFAATPLHYVDRGIAKSGLGRHEEAIADHNRALQIWPDSWPAIVNRGIAYIGRGQFEKAISDFDEALRLQPDSVSAVTYSNRAAAKNSLGLHEHAIADCDQALSLDPGTAGAYVNRGEAKAALGRIAEARSDLDAALALPQTSGNDSLVAEIKQIMQSLDNSKRD